MTKVSGVLSFVFHSYHSPVEAFCLEDEIGFFDAGVDVGFFVYDFHDAFAVYEDFFVFVFFQKGIVIHDSLLV